MCECIILTCEKQSPIGNVFVEPDGRVEWNESIENSLSEHSDEVPTHGEKQSRVRPHHTTGSTSRYRYTVPTNPSQGSVLSLNREI